MSWDVTDAPDYLIRNSAGRALAHNEKNVEHFSYTFHWISNTSSHCWLGSFLLKHSYSGFKYSKIYHGYWDINIWNQCRAWLYLYGYVFILIICLKMSWLKNSKRPKVYPEVYIVLLILINNIRETTLFPKRR